MKAEKRARLEDAGWRVGTVGEFLGLTREEQEFIELKVALAHQLRRLRLDSGLTQADVAKRLGTSQSRVAKMEACDHSVSVDLLVMSLLSLGATRADVGDVIRSNVA